MRRIFLKIAYDGTNYIGWQSQPAGDSVEGRLNKAISELTGESIQVIGASRTDSGVHAYGNVAVFDTNTRIPAEKFAMAINQRLPLDIRITSSRECGLGWHPRKNNCIKTYEYSIFSERIENPMTRLYAHHCYYPLNVEKMREAARYLIGEHDFTSFTNPDSQVLIEGGSAVREIYSIDIETEHELRYDRAVRAVNNSEASELSKNEESLDMTTNTEVLELPQKGYYGMIRIRITGGGFLYNMVRIIAGTLLRVGTGLYSPEYVGEILESKDRQKAGPTAEARGLCLIDMEYEEEIL
ncbi:MAG: tRNA pseudouridine(38-40) synthase TruA [Eubacteriales bacterium]|nr:tRNA pseudouridine(38-40) synthase TruA [Eubacteriales bacterium]